MKLFLTVFAAILAAAAVILTGIYAKARLDQWEQAKWAFIAEMNNENARTKAICDGYMAEARQWAASTRSARNMPARQSSFAKGNGGNANAHAGSTWRTSSDAKASSIFDSAIAVDWLVCFAEEHTTRCQSEWRHEVHSLGGSLFLINAVKRSIGRGKKVVVLCSLEISRIVCRKRSCSAIGSLLIIAAACTIFSAA